MRYFKMRTLRLLVISAVAAMFMLPPRLTAQHVSSRSTIKVVVVSGGASGLSAGETDSFFSNLQGKLSQFSDLSVFLKADLARGLNK